MAGPLFENFVIQELVKYFYNHGKRANIYYLRTHNQLEIDLIVEKNSERIPIEIKLSRTPNMGMAKSIERFMKLFSGLEVQQGMIVSLTDETIPLTANVNTRSIESLLGKLGNAE